MLIEVLNLDGETIWINPEWVISARIVCPYSRGPKRIKVDKEGVRLYPEGSSVVVVMHEGESDIDMLTESFEDFLEKVNTRA